MNKLEQAMEDHKQGKWKQADLAYEAIIQEEPENAEVMYLLATSKMSQNKLNEALPIIDRAIENNKKAPAYFQLKGTILARMGQADKALEVLEKALQENPNLYQSHITVGHIYYTKGNKKDAEKHFKMARKVDSTLPEAHVNLAKIMIDEGHVQTAINTLRTLEKQHPEQAVVKMMMGQAFLENGAYNFAENYFQKVLAMHPEYDLAGLYLGVAKLQTGDVENAEKLIHTFNQQYQNTREGLAALGLLMFKNNRFKTAIEYLRNAIGKGLAPTSWKVAFYESLARIGQYQPAIDFYKKIEKNNKAATYRLGELYERQAKPKKARQQYKLIEQTDNKYVSSLLGMARCYLTEEKAGKAEKQCNKILQTNQNHAEATLLLLTALLRQKEEMRALEILQGINYGSYNDAYKKAFRLQHGLILDKHEKFDQAMDVFQNEKKREMIETPENKKMSEQEVKKTATFKTKTNDDIKDPVFIIGSASTAMNNFVSWIHKNGVAILNDRLVSFGRTDILYGFREIDALFDVDDEMVRTERKIYQQKTKLLTEGLAENKLIVDCMYINPYQIAIIKKFFPQATIVLLTRDTADIWLSQKVFEKEPVSSGDWNEVKNQIISMDLNLVQVDVDKWLDNDSKTLKQLGDVFEKELVENHEQKRYWQKTMFPKGHWKNYKKLLS